jgi:SAM-dependent methyltransferase
MMKKIISDPAEFMEMANAFRVSRIILTGYELEVFSILKGTLTSSEIAGKLGTDVRATDRLLNALVAIGLIEKNKNSFSNTAFSSRFLVKGRPGFMGGLGHMLNLWRTWSTLTESVRTGKSVAIEDSIEDRGNDWREAFIAAMHARAPQQAREVAALLDLSKTTRILDVGGGSGAFSFEFIRQNKKIKAVVFDLPTIVPITQGYIDREGFSGSVTTMAGDYLKDGFGEGYDFIFLSAIIHINSPDENRSLIKRCIAALDKGGQLVILDHIMNEDRTEPKAGAIFALNMLVGTEKGDTYTESEIESWMGDAGLKEIRRADAAQGTSLMIGIKG